MDKKMSENSVNKTHILVVNINNLKYTRDCVDDLQKQNVPFDLTIVDQNSTESGTKEWYEKLKKGGWHRTDCNLNIVLNDKHEPLNHVWNLFYWTNKNDYLCFLNNDLRITDNFVRDGEEIFRLNEEVGAVVHPTNHPKYVRKKNKLVYEISRGRIKQGWDFTFRRDCYNEIPKVLKTYCGDDYLFEMLYQDGHQLAFALSSPILHYCSQSSKYRLEPPSDVPRYKKLGFKHDLVHNVQYTVVRPTAVFQRNWITQNT